MDPLGLKRERAASALTLVRNAIKTWGQPVPRKCANRSRLPV